MKTVLFIVFIISSILLIGFGYLLIRNDLVLAFRKKLWNTGSLICYNYLDLLKSKNFTDKEFEYFTEVIYKEKYFKVFKSILDISYDKMLFSLKPLKPKYWLNKEQLEFLNKQ